MDAAAAARSTFLQTLQVTYKYPEDAANYFVKELERLFAETGKQLRWDVEAKRLDADILQAFLRACYADPLESALRGAFTHLTNTEWGGGGSKVEPSTPTVASQLGGLTDRAIVEQTKDKFLMHMTRIKCGASSTQFAVDGEDLKAVLNVVLNAMANNYPALATSACQLVLQAGSSTYSVEQEQYTAVPPFYVYVKFVKWQKATKVNMLLFRGQRSVATVDAELYIWREPDAKMDELHRAAVSKLASQFNVQVQGALPQPPASGTTGSTSGAAAGSNAK